MQSKFLFSFSLLLILCNISYKVKAQTVDVQDSLALVELYDSTNGVNWINNTNWLKGPVATWFGITVNENGVTEINLRLNNLSGNIPLSIGNLKNLTSLDLYSNQLTGAIPDSLGKLSQLLFLSFEENQLSGTIPSELAKLTNLGDLGLGFNQLTGSIPEWLGNLSNLKSITLSHNQLTGIIPPQLGKLSQLDGLFLYENQLTGNLPLELTGLQKLRFLSVNNNKLSGNFPLVVTQMKALEWITLNDNQFNGSIPPEIGDLSNLSFLSLEHNNFSGNIPPEFGNLQKLQFLYLGYNNISGAIPEEMGDMEKLQGLQLTSNLLSGYIPESLVNTSGSFSFDISSNFFTYTGIEQTVLNHASNPYSFQYAPQGQITLYQTADHFYVSAGGTLSNNTYKWFKVGQPDSIVITGDSTFYPTESGQYYAKVTNVICKDLTLYSRTDTYFGVLPVTITNLKANQQNNIIEITWASLTETNIDRYEIQRSNDAENFVMAGKLSAVGKGTQKTDYSFNDLTPWQGKNYYRLKIIDKDGSISYSKTVMTNLNENKVITMAYPNPAKDILYINTNINTLFSLINQAGQVLLSKNINGKGTINISGLSSGLYYLRNNNSGVTEKIIILK